MHLCVHLKSENIFLFVIYFIHKYRDFKKEVLSDIVIKIGVQLFFFLFLSAFIQPIKSKCSSNDLLLPYGTYTLQKQKNTAVTHF